MTWFIFYLIGSFLSLGVFLTGLPHIYEKKYTGSDILAAMVLSFILSWSLIIAVIFSYLMRD